MVYTQTKNLRDRETAVQNLLKVKLRNVITQHKVPLIEVKVRCFKAIVAYL